MVCEGGCRIQVWMSLGIMSYLIMFVSVLFLSVQYNVHIGCERSVDDIYFFWFFFGYIIFLNLYLQKKLGVDYVFYLVANCFFWVQYVDFIDPCGSGHCHVQLSMAEHWVTHVNSDILQ